MVTSLARIATASGATVQHESSIPGGQRPADLLLSFCDGSAPIAVDCTMVHPLKPSDGANVAAASRCLADAEVAILASYIGSLQLISDDEPDLCVSSKKEYQLQL